MSVFILRVFVFVTYGGFFALFIRLWQASKKGKRLGALDFVLAPLLCLVGAISVLALVLLVKSHGP